MLHQGQGCWCGEAHTAGEVYYINIGERGFDRGPTRKRRRRNPDAGGVRSPGSGDPGDGLAGDVPDGPRTEADEGEEAED